MSTFLQQLINGISLGAIYSLIALGYTMVYGVLKLINFATETCTWWRFRRLPANGLDAAPGYWPELTD